MGFSDVLTNGLRGGCECDFLMRQIKNQSKANFALTGGDGGI